MHQHKNRYLLAIHGGAGTLLPEVITPEQRNAHEVALTEALEEGLEILRKGGTALDAVEASVVILEDCPLFNAGRGSVFTHSGKHEMDAAIMSGSNRKAGAVAGISNLRNPVKLARAAMEKSGHVMLIGTEAEELARQWGLTFEEDSWFYSEYRYQQWKRALEKDLIQLDHTPDDVKYGTVGAVALDKNGHLAAATSTGGLTNKRYGRVGDTPLIGCGTYADDLVAVSCTGWGEYFIRTVAAHQLAMRFRLGQASLENAALDVLNDVAHLGGDGGLIAVNAEGDLAMPFNTPGMYRAAGGSELRPIVKIFNE
ncbi:MAG: isoaspartyl peptidase/L-asparaginase family protein [Thermaurantimonas sp.]